MKYLSKHALRQNYRTKTLISFPETIHACNLHVLLPSEAQSFPTLKITLER